MLALAEGWLVEVLVLRVCVCGVQENPSEEDAAIVDKVLTMRLTKKEASWPSLYSCQYSQNPASAV